MANNNAILNAVLSGATGAFQQRWVTSQNVGSYAQFAITANAIAVAVDALIAPTSIDNGQRNLMQGIAQGIFADRWPQDVSNYNAIANAIVTLYNAVATKLLPEAGGGGGAVSSVFARIGAVVAAVNDYLASQVDNNSLVVGDFVSDALNALDNEINNLTTTSISNVSNLPGASATAALNYFAQATQAVAGGAAPALAFATNRYQVLTLNQNASPTVTIPPAGVEAYLEVIQPAAGGPFVISAWPATIDWDVVSTGGGAPSLGTAVNAINLFRFISNGTRLRGAAHGEY